MHQIKVNKFLKLFSNCIVVRGAKRVSICDLQRNQIFFFPLSFLGLYDASTHSIPIESIKRELQIESREILNEYIDFIISNEIGFFCKKGDLKKFPLLNSDWLFPSHISNCIIDFKISNSNFLTENLLQQLDELCCYFIQLRFLEPIENNELQSILTLIDNSQIKSLEIIMPIKLEDKNDKNIINIASKHGKIKSIILTGSHQNKVVQKDGLFDCFIYESITYVNDIRHCGIIDIQQFTVNITHYTESLAHNTCLNRKISIDTEGNIKNCPSMKESFGNIKDTTLQEAIEKPGFKKHWNITKDQIAVCKDCEFRHVCTDCRAYLEDPEDDYSKPLKCGYNPYTCEWEEWSTNPLKQKAIDYYGMREIIKLEQ